MLYPESHYLEFVRINAPRRRTSFWEVKSKSSGALLGAIKWFGRWRQYVFYPSHGTLYNPDCMRDIITVIEEAMKERREALTYRRLEREALT